MRTLIVFNHPYRGSYCNAILEAVSKGLRKGQHEIDLIHLDKDGFNPVMSEADLKAFVAHQPIDPQVISYGERVKKADHLIFIFPIWWDIMPAMGLLTGNCHPASPMTIIQGDLGWCHCSIT